MNILRPFDPLNPAPRSFRVYNDLLERKKTFHVGCSHGCFSGLKRSAISCGSWRYSAFFFFVLMFKWEIAPSSRITLCCANDYELMFVKSASKKRSAGNWDIKTSIYNNIRWHLKKKNLNRVCANWMFVWEIIPKWDLNEQQDFSCELISPYSSKIRLLAV